MKVTRLQAFEIGGVAGAFVRERIIIKLSKRFYALPENKKASNEAMKFLLLGLAGWVLLIAMTYDPAFEPTRAFALYQLKHLVSIVQIATVGFWLTMVILGLYATVLGAMVASFALSIRIMGDLNRRLWLTINKARDEEVDL